MYYVRSFVAVLFMVTLTACVQSEQQTANTHQNAQDANTVQVSFPTDFSDRQRLVGFADNVFVGHVLSQDRTGLNNNLPVTFYTVEVLKNLKGDLNGKVTVRQEGGWDERQQAVVLFEETSLLIPDQTYLFVTISRNGVDFHTTITKYGHVLLADETSKEQVVKEFEHAITHEIPYSRDTARSSRNLVSPHD